jgi:ribosomal protein S18 acetylase RimI-like enzyme
MTHDLAVQLRLATPDDAAIIRTLTREAYQPWVAVIGREPLPMTADYEMAVRQHRFDLAYRDGALIGLIETSLEADCLLVVNVAVAPALQGRGVGRRLLAHAESLARAAERSKLRLYTNAAWERNVALYLRFGYRIEREEPKLGGVTVHMVKTLA